MHGGRVDARPHTANGTAQKGESASARSLSHPRAALRARGAASTTVDVALDAAAFAALKDARADASPAADNHGPEMSWTRQGVAQVEPPTMEAPTGPEAYMPDAPPDDPLDDSYHNNGYGDGGSQGEDDEGVALTTLLESLLFVASEPVDSRQLAQTLAQPLEIIELGLAELADYYQRSLRGLRLQRFNDKVQLVTAPAAAPFIETFLNLDNSTRLSSPALETLAVIAYRQPVTRAQIEAVRGVDCSGVLRSLMLRGLVVEVGRMEGIGRPILYGVTELFMQHFGLMEMGELPPLEETDADRLWAATVLDEENLDESRSDASHE
jgi:segregation and condensation protein B